MSIGTCETYLATLTIVMLHILLAHVSSGRRYSYDDEGSMEHENEHAKAFRLGGRYYDLLGRIQNLTCGPCQGVLKQIQKYVRRPVKSHPKMRSYRRQIRETTAQDYYYPDVGSEMYMMSSSGVSEEDGLDAPIGWRTIQGEWFQKLRAESDL